MALSVVKRPDSYKVGTTPVTGTFTNGSTVVTSTAHGLSTGDVIYISTGQAIGFWAITKIGTDTFSISEFIGASAVTFYGAGTFTYFSTTSSTHWSAVHLPIVYKLLSTLWPVNSVDTIRTVSSFTNDNGYVKLTLSGAIKSDVSELEFVKLTGPQAGIYQILGFYSTSVITIDLAYNANLSFGTVQYYYRSYRAKIRVYAGINSGHTFAGMKPIELITEQDIVPDESGIVEINVSDYAKDKIEVLKNNLNLASLPNDVDAWCDLHITYAEAYDYSAGGYGILDYVGAYTDDTANQLVQAPSTWQDGVVIPALGSLVNFASKTGTQFTYGAGAAAKAAAQLPVNISPGSVINTITMPIALTGVIIEVHAFLCFINSSGVIVSQSNNISIIGTNSDPGVFNTFTPFTGHADYLVLVLDFSSGSPASYATTITVTPSAIVYDASVNNRDAINAQLPFKNRHSGSMSDYMIDSTFLGKWLTPSVYPRLSVGQYFDISFLRTSSSAITVRREVLLRGVVQNVFSDSISSYDRGVYRIQLSQSIYLEDQIKLKVYQGSTLISQEITIEVDSTCYSNAINLSWKNYLGEPDYWTFQGFADYGVDILGTKEQTKNIYPEWPRSYGEDADTIRQETARDSNQTIVVRAENLTKDQVDDLFRIKTSPLVMIVNSVTDRRTVIPDASSFVYHPQANKLFDLSFTLSFTDNLPVQKA